MSSAPIVSKAGFQETLTTPNIHRDSGVSTIKSLDHNIKAMQQGMLNLGNNVTVMHGKFGIIDSLNRNIMQLFTMMQLVSQHVNDSTVKNTLSEYSSRLATFDQKLNSTNQKLDKLIEQQSKSNQTIEQLNNKLDTLANKVNQMHDIMTQNNDADINAEIDADMLSSFASSALSSNAFPAKHSFMPSFRIGNVSLVHMDVPTMDETNLQDDQDASMTVGQFGSKPNKQSKMTIDDISADQPNTIDQPNQPNQTNQSNTTDTTDQVEIDKYLSEKYPHNTTNNRDVYDLLVEQLGKSTTEIDSTDKNLDEASNSNVPNNNAPNNNALNNETETPVESNLTDSIVVVESNTDDQSNQEPAELPQENQKKKPKKVTKPKQTKPRKPRKKAE